MADKQQKSFNPYMYTLEIGFRISIPLVAFMLLGIWLDKRLGTGHTMLFVGIGLSLLTSVYGIKQMIDNMKKDS